MPHTQPNFTPVSGGGGRLEGFNGIANAVKGASNNHFGAGVGGNSSSSGNSFNGDFPAIKKSFWAQITRRLRFFNVPPLSYLRIPDVEKHRIPKSVYDVAYRGSNGVIFHRNPWESYDAYVSPVTGVWAEKKENPVAMANVGSSGESYLTQWNSFYWRAKESRYVYYGDQKRLSSFNYASEYDQDFLLHAQRLEYEHHVGYCPRFVWTYSWCQVIESVNLNRAEHLIFKLTHIRKPRSPEPTSRRKEPLYMGLWPGPDHLHPVNTPASAGSTRAPVYDCSECNIAIEGVSQGGLVGKAMNGNAAYEVNNCRTLVGSYVRMFFGDGNHFIFQNPQYPSRGLGVKLPNIPQSPYHFHSGYDVGEF